TSTRPGDLDLLLRKILYAADARTDEEGDGMADSLSDFSKIQELQEIKKLHDEMQERVRLDLQEKDLEIERLREALSDRQGRPAPPDEAALRAENERLARQIALVRQEYEAKIDRLNARIRELSLSSAPAAAAGEADKKGFFRR